MKFTSTQIIAGVSVIAAILIIGFVVYANPKNAKGKELIPFAQCLKDKGLQFYGAFWCPHCAAQKALFGAAVKYLPYNECSTPDAAGQLKVCDDKGVKQYPTWFFPDGTTAVGEQSLTTLAQKSGCMLPAGYDNPTSASSTPASVGSSSAAK